MTDKKYELTDETIVVDDHVLHRIRALKDFYPFKAGDLGGFIETEDNLSHEGSCWVYNNAKVYGNAQVYDRAKVHRLAMVLDYARVFGNAEVCGDARVLYESRIFHRMKVTGVLAERRPLEPDGE